MVKDFKYIIKRILIGVGIALCLMYLKGGLIANAYALSCASDNKNIYGVLPESFWGNIPNTTSGTNQNIVYYRREANTDGTQRIYFRGYDYVDVYVPIMWTLSFANSPIYSQGQSQPYSFNIESSPPFMYLEDNTNNPNNNSWTQGSYDNGFYIVRYFKKAYPNSDYVNITALRIGVPTSYYNTSTDMFLWVNKYFQVHHYKCDGTQAITNAINENTNAVNETNDLINSTDTDDPSSDITSMNDKLASNGSITQLLTLPIQLYRNILNASNGSCSRFELGELLGHNLILPCINLQNILGGTLWSIIDILCSGLFILAFRKKMVDIFNNMTSLKDRGNELE